MTTTFFLVGLLSSLACGLALASADADWRSRAIWMVGAAVGAANAATRPTAWRASASAGR